MSLAIRRPSRRSRAPLTFELGEEVMGLELGGGGIKLKIRNVRIGEGGKQRTDTCQL